MASESEISQCDTGESPHASEEHESSPTTSVRQRRGRGRPRRRGRSSSRRGRGATASRTRGSRRSSKTKPREEAEGSRPIGKAVEDRKKRIQAQIDRMSEVELREAFSKLLIRHPSLIFEDVIPKAQQPGGYHPESSDSSPDWCICMHCREMPTDAEKLCCGRDPNNCISDTPDFNLLVLDEGVLAIGRWQRNDILALDEDNDRARSNRHQAYRQFVIWQYQHLGAGNRVVIPSCAVWRIRDTFPDAFGQYRGFVPTRLG